jgi:hypothetical protein
MSNMDEQYDKLRSLDHDLAECCYYNCLGSDKVTIYQNIVVKEKRNK